MIQIPQGIRAFGARFSADQLRKKLLFGANDRALVNIINCKFERKIVAWLCLVLKARGDGYICVCVCVGWGGGRGLKSKIIL